jgi:transketolase
LRDAFIARLTQAARRDSRITLITGDLGFSVLDDFAASLPRQFINAGVAEQNMTGLASGLALDGRIVFTYSIANFSTLRCLEQIRNDAAYHKANVKVVAVGGGFSYGALGFSHHATEDIAILRAVPGVAVVAPGCDWEAEEATDAVIAHQGTCYLRLDRSSAGRTGRAPETFQIGRARIIREGNALTLISTGGILGEVMEAAERLAASNVECRVVSMHTVKPLDRECILDACRSTGGIMTIEEHGIDGGLGGAVAELCLEADVRPRLFHRIGLRGGFASTVGSQQFLRARYSMDTAAIINAATQLLHGNARVQ